MMARLKRSWPLFLHIFAVMLATLLLVQVLNAAVFIVMPPPRPIIYTTSLIAGVARTGRDPTDLLTVQTSERPAGNTSAARERALAELIAADLHLPASAVAVSLEQHLPPTIVGVFRLPMPQEMNVLRRPMRPINGALFGDFAVSVHHADGRWQIIQPAERPFSSWRARIVLWFVFAVVGITPFAWAMSRRIAKPIALFAAAADRLGRDPRAEPLALEGPPEIAEAAATFNQMQERLNRYVEDRTTLIAAVAHDLRTPLMRLALRLENAPDAVRLAGEEDIREMSERIGAAMAFVREMTQLVRRQKLDLRSLAESVAADAIDRGGSVILVPGPAIGMEGDAASLKALIGNLVENALLYAGNARIALHRGRSVVSIEVSDNGPGMEQADVIRAFEPFFRAERSRSRATGGTGLGLASVRAVARAHGGDATIENRETGGMLARVTLPL